MNEAETRRELIDPKLKKCGWGVVDNSKVLCERNVNAYRITDGYIQTGGGRAKSLIADYILVYKGVKLAIIEAKNNKLQVSEGVAQAKLYAQKLNLETTYSPFHVVFQIGLFSQRHLITGLTQMRWLIHVSAYGLV